MNTISVKDLACELGVRQVEVERQVTRLCLDAQWGPKNVVAHAVSDNGSCLLHSVAANEIRELLTPAVA